MAHFIELNSATAAQRTLHFRLFTSNGTSPDTGASGDSVVLAFGSASTFVPNVVCVALNANQGMYSVQLLQSSVQTLGQYSVYHTQGDFPQHVANINVVNSNLYSSQSNVPLVPTVTNVTNLVGSNATVTAMNSGVITNAAFAADSISSDKIADNALGAEHFADNAFSTHSIGLVAANQPGVSIPLVAVVTDVTNLVDSNATVTVMNANVITNAAFAADSISSDKIADNALGAEHFADNAFSTHSIGIVAANQPGVTIPTVTAITDAVTVGTNNDKTGYSMAAGGIVAASFAASAIDAAALATDAGQEIADRILLRSVGGGTDSTRSTGQALMALRNRILTGVSVLTVFNPDDVTSAWTASIVTAPFPLGGIIPS